MRFPRVVLLAIPVAAGLMLPAFGPALTPPAGGVIGMSHDGFVVDGVEPDEAAEAAGIYPEITIHVGDTITFQNNSRWIHIVGAGDKGLLHPPGHSSMTERRLMEENADYTTPKWLVAGTYTITCSVHPDMNARVIVLPKA